MTPLKFIALAAVALFALAKGASVPIKERQLSEDSPGERELWDDYNDNDYYRRGYSRYGRYYSGDGGRGGYYGVRGGGGGWEWDAPQPQQGANAPNTQTGANAPNTQAAAKTGAGAQGGAQGGKRNLDDDSDYYNRRGYNRYGRYYGGGGTGYSRGGGWSNDVAQPQQGANAPNSQTGANAPNTQPAAKTGAGAQGGGK